MSKWNFRLAEPADAPAFSKWAAENKLIDPKDLKAATKGQNPTVVFFAVEDETGEVVAFAPFYCQMTLGFLGFNPEKDAETRKQALEVMLDGALAFAVQFGVREITTLSKEKYPVARWATDHGFSVDARQLFTFDINRILEQAEEKA
jgi:hypothetical protein